jgi:hypothetical protein
MIKILINSDLNNLLIRIYSFNIKKQCKSFKELEKTLEMLAHELSEEQKRQIKRTQVKYEN